VARSKEKALGKGLAALIRDSKLAEGGGQGRLREMPVTDIAVSRRQPRRMFAADELQELAESVRHLGLVQPVVVRPLAGDDAGGSPAADGPQFELIAGERRLRAAKMAGLQTVPALIRPADDVASLEIALAENVAREDLNAIEEAHAYAALADEFGITHERIAELVGRSRVAVTNVLRLLELPDDVQAMIEAGELSEGHARAILGTAGHEERRKVARAVVGQGLTVRQTEALVRKLAEAASAGGRQPAAPASPDEELDGFGEELYGVFEAPVRIRSGARGGKIEIRFKDRPELERLMALLRSLRG
jgi:ParB family transcriptional regulator, chromosome partitioning protein